MTCVCSSPVNGVRSAIGGKHERVTSDLGPAANPGEGRKEPPTTRWLPTGHAGRAGVGTSYAP